MTERCTRLNDIIYELFIRKTFYYYYLNVGKIVKNYNFARWFVLLIKMCESKYYTRLRLVL